MKNIFFLLIFILVACSSGKTKDIKNVAINGTSPSLGKTVLDTIIISPILDELMQRYLVDTSISKYDSIVKLLLVEFYYEKGDTILSISGHSVMPVIGPQNKFEGYEFKGFSSFKDIPVLVYDNKTSFGVEFYNDSKLRRDSLVLDECPESLIALPKWLYKVCSNGEIILVKKRPMFLLKK